MAPVTRDGEELSFILLVMTPHPHPSRTRRDSRWPNQWKVWRGGNPPPQLTSSARFKSPSILGRIRRGTAQPTKEKDEKDTAQLRRLLRYILTVSEFYTHPLTTQKKMLSSRLQCALALLCLALAISCVSAAPSDVKLRQLLQRSLFAQGGKQVNQCTTHMCICQCTFYNHISSRLAVSGLAYAQEEIWEPVHGPDSENDAREILLGRTDLLTFYGVNSTGVIYEGKNCHSIF